MLQQTKTFPLSNRFKKQVGLIFSIRPTEKGIWFCFFDDRKKGLVWLIYKRSECK